MENGSLAIGERAMIWKLIDKSRGAMVLGLQLKLKMAREENSAIEKKLSPFKRLAGWE